MKAGRQHLKIIRQELIKRGLTETEVIKTINNLYPLAEEIDRLYDELQKHTKEVMMFAPPTPFIVPKIR